MYNKRFFTKLNAKKLLRKSGKSWIVVSAALLGLVAGGYALSNVTNVNLAPTAIVRADTSNRLGADVIGGVGLRDTASGQYIARATTPANARIGSYQLNGINTHLWNFNNGGSAIQANDPYNRKNIENNHLQENDVTPVQNSLNHYHHFGINGFGLDGSYDGTHANGELNDPTANDYGITVKDSISGQPLAYINGSTGSFGNGSNAGLYHLNAPAGTSGWNTLGKTEINDSNKHGQITVTPNDLVDAPGYSLGGRSNDLTNGGYIKLVDGNGLGNSADDPVLATISLGPGASYTKYGNYTVTTNQLGDNGTGRWHVDDAIGYNGTTGPDGSNGNMYIDNNTVKGDNAFVVSLDGSQLSNNDTTGIGDGSDSDAVGGLSGTKTIQLFDAYTKKRIGTLDVGGHSANTIAFKSNTGYGSDTFTIVDTASAGSPSGSNGSVTSGSGAIVKGDAGSGDGSGDNTSYVYLIPKISFGGSDSGLSTKGNDSPTVNGHINLVEKGIDGYDHVVGTTSNISTDGLYNVTLPHGWVTADGNAGSANVNVSLANATPSLYVKPDSADGRNDVVGLTVVKPVDPETLNEAVNVPVIDGSSDSDHNVQVGTINIPKSSKTGEYRIDLPAGWVVNDGTNHNYADVLVDNDMDSNPVVYVEPTESDSSDFDGQSLSLKYEGNSVTTPSRSSESRTSGSSSSSEPGEELPGSFRGGYPGFRGFRGVLPWGNGLPNFRGFGFNWGPNFGDWFNTPWAFNHNVNNAKNNNANASVKPNNGKNMIKANGSKGVDLAGNPIGATKKVSNNASAPSVNEQVSGPSHHASHHVSGTKYYHSVIRGGKMVARHAIRIYSTKKFSARHVIGHIRKGGRVRVRRAVRYRHAYRIKLMRGGYITAKTSYVRLLG